MTIIIWRKEKFFYNNNFELNDNHNLEYYETDMNETLERENCDESAYDHLLSTEVFLPNAEREGTVLQQVNNI